jgi:DNA topoisomerase-1
MDAASVDLQTALGLLSLPRDLGPFPETGEMIQAGIGRFGPYIKCEGTYVSLKEDDVLTIGLNRAISLMADAPRKPKAQEVGKHPDDGKPITIRQGRYGYYVQHGATRATLPKGTDKDALTPDGAVELIRAKEAASGKTPKKTKTSKKAAKASDDTADELQSAAKSEAPAPAKKKSAPKKKKAAPEPVE